MIDIQFLDKSKTKGIQGFGVSINNIIDKKAHYYSPFKKRYTLSFADTNLFEEISKHTYEEIGAKFYAVKHDFESQNWDFKFDTSIHIHENQYDKKPLNLYVEFSIEWEEWNKPYSIIQFAGALYEIISQNNDNCIYYQEDEDFVTNGFGIQFPIKITDIIQNDIERILNTTEKILQETRSLLIKNLDTEVLTTFFSFPEHIKTACKQYLVYFAQFLMDMGIEAETEINEESNKTLFKVTPKNKGESLEMIKSALDAYLNAPAFEEQELSNVSTDISIVQWQSNILHFKSQLMLAQATIQLKEATIQSLQLTNFQYQTLLENEHSNKGKSVNDEEEIIKGVVSVNKYEGKGFSVNFAEIVRKLKRKFL